jgi:hypothetical protein
MTMIQTAAAAINGLADRLAHVRLTQYASCSG